MDSKKHYGCCGVVRKMDFEDRHPVIAGIVLAVAFVLSVAIVMVVL